MSLAKSVLLLVAAWASVAATPPRVPDATEVDVKSALLYKITKFVTWPDTAFDEPEDPIVVGVLGEDPFGTKLDKAFKGRKASGRGFELRRFPDLASLEDCHVLFVSPGSAGDLSDVLREVEAEPTLLVGDSKRFAHSGGIVNFYKRGASVRLEINVDSAKRADLRISAKLLDLARIIRD